MSALQLQLPQSVVLSDVTPPDSDSSCMDISSPVHLNTFIPSSSSGVIPLRPAKTVSVSRRAVFFSPKNDTKYFHSAESILTSSRPAPPPSIRSYHDSDPFGSPSASRSSPLPLSETPSLVRGILKQRVHAIRLAASAEEGTLNNKEAARLVVSGLRPKLMARDSFQLAMLRKAAGDGKEKAGDDMPGSDDSTSSEEGAPIAEREGSSEEEEAIEVNGALATGSIVGIILDGAEDLLTLEEAYNTLTFRLRHRIPADPETELSAKTREDIRIATQPLRDEAPAMVRAMQRDLARLMGKVPNSEVSSNEAGASPFRALIPLRDATPINRRSRLTPSPTPISGAISGAYSPDEKPARQGYTESEVRYRRESSGVGSAALKFLAFTLHSSHLFSCFSEADLQALLEQVLIIPRTPRLPTPNPKRTYYLSILILAQIKVPMASILPIREKIVRAVESATSDSMFPLVGGSKDGPSQIRKEGIHAITNLVSTYPSVFFQHYSDLLPGCLRALVSQNSLFRNKASTAAAAFAAAKYSLIADLQDRLPEQREAWIKTKAIAQKSEFFIISHLKTALKAPGKSSPIYGNNGEKKTEWSALEQIFKETVGSVDVHWACATWAVLVSLMGSAYSSSGLAAGFDHIMDPSTNVFRPLLGRTAWNYAVHAYLSSDSVSSYDNRLVQSFRPFGPSAHEDALERLATIQMPVDLALAMATDSNAFSKALINVGDKVDERCTWQRLEKSKKLQWVITCGLGAASIVYVYTGIALYHEDQPAKEMTALTGLPSSDGAPVPESVLEDSRIERLDKTWEKVVAPMLKTFSSICGVDRLKSHGWAMLDAITSQRVTPWTLDRLLSPRYLSGEPFYSEKDANMKALLDELEADAIRAADIPSWGSTWIVRRIDQLLEVFQENLSGISGLNDPASVKWVRDEHGNDLIPVVLSRVWSNLLRALITTKHTEIHSACIQLVTRHLVQAFNRDPITYVPISSLDADGRCTVNIDTIRIGLTTHLLDAMVAILGREAIGAVRLSSSTQDEEEGDVHAVEFAIARMAFGADSNAQATVAGSLLGQLLRTQELSFPLQSSVRNGFKRLIGKILDAGSIQGFPGKLLGDLTNHMPWIFSEQEEVQLDVWRLLALKWTEVIDLQPFTTAASTNHTGALLVSLLSGPFRGRQVTSVWHQHANQQDLAVWQALLKATVLRFRAKRVGSNMGVVESLAGHLGDFLEAGEKTSSTTITLSCLTAATSWIAFGPTKHDHGAHFSINENFVPVDFLNLVSRSLIDSYPQSETLAQSDSGVAISPAVSDLLGTLQLVFERMPPEFVGQVITPLKPGLAVWLADEARLADDNFAARLDDLYVTLLTILTSALTSRHITATSETLDELIDIYAPRLSRARSSAVPTAFKTFWQQSFQDVRLDYSDDVAQFLRDVMAAVPGMITASGLAVPDSWSEEDSLARYPHSQALVVRGVPIAISEVPESTIVHEDLMDVTALGPDTSAISHPDPTGEYDADVSQSMEMEAPPPIPEPVSAPSPSPSDAESEREISEGALLPVEWEDGDVFGPAAMVQPMTRKRWRKPRPLSDAQSLPDAKRIKLETSLGSNSLPNSRPALVANSDDDLNDCIEVQQPLPSMEPLQPALSTSRTRAPSTQPAPIKPSILSSATRWLSRVPSFGLFSPAQPTVEDESIPTSQSDRSARKARRAKQRETPQFPVMEAESSGKPRNGKRRLIPVVDLSTSRQARKRRRASVVTDAPPEIEGDEEDELLLSPDSARRRRREEEGAIIDAVVQRVTGASSAPPWNLTRNQEDSQASAGRFDDAPEEASPTITPMEGSPRPNMPTPTRRSLQQARVLAMVEQAAQARAAIENLDLEGVLALLRNVDELWTAATANLQAKAEDARKLKRAKREP